VLVNTISAQNEKAAPLIGHGWWFEEFALGRRFTTKKRTITEADLGAYINLTWFTEELFGSVEGTHERSIQGRVVPAGMVFAFAEGLVCPTLEFTGQALLSFSVNARGPTFVGDTIHVVAEVIEAREESKGARGLVRTRNSVRNTAGGTVIEYEALRLVAKRSA
jgi:acyl dehydratase